jgi:hypothetical protein
MACAVTLGSCEPATEAEPPAEPDAAEIIEVPEVIDLPAQEAIDEIDAVEGLAASFDSAPADVELCTVEDQDETGEVALDTDVVLTLNCQIEVPDVVGMAADEAQAEIHGTEGLTASLDPEPEDPALCTAAAQDEEGAVDEGTDVVLTLECSEEDDNGSAVDGCEPGYPNECLDSTSEDYDCEGGEGDGPDYVAGPIDVEEPDRFDLDRDGDGLGCDAY